MKQLLYILSLLISLSVVSCKNSDTDILKEEIDLNIQINVGDKGTILSYGGIGTPQENTINRLRVLIFDSNTGALEENEYFDATTNPALGTFPKHVKYTLQIGSKRVCLLGNEPIVLKSTLDALRNFSALVPLTMEDATTLNANHADLPFYITKTISAHSNSLPTILQFGLKRSVGKVQVSIMKDNANLKTVELVSLQLLNVPNKSTLTEGSHLSSPSLVPLILQVFNLTLSNTLQVLTFNQPYVYEHFPTVVANSTVLRVTLKIDGVSNRIDVPIMIGVNAQGQSVVGIRRNLIAYMRLTVLGDHLKVDYTSVPWDEESPWDKNPGEDDSNVIFIPWDEESSWDKNLGEDYSNIIFVPWDEEFTWDWEMGT